MIAPALQQRTDMVRRACAVRYGRNESEVQLIYAPYRICPLGAHIDHQLGPVSAVAIEQGILIAYVESDDIRILSEGYDDEVQFDVVTPPVRNHDWADYARGAWLALSTRHQLNSGAQMYVEGHLSEAGISSSAAVGLGYLLAFSRVNDISLSAAELIELDRVIENEFLGLKNGVLDQSAITLAKQDHLTVIDCHSGGHVHIAQPEAFCFLAVYSGVKEPLIGSNKFNNRVEECLLAGAALRRLTKGEEVDLCQLGHIDSDAWLAQETRLQPHLQRRARHFFGECERVRQGAVAWRNGDAETFGRLMFASCRSSIDNYETGSEELISLFELLAVQDGVYGARFSGAGFRGCAVAVVNADAVPDIVQSIEQDYGRHYPALKERMWALTSQAAEGLRVL